MLHLDDDIWRTVYCFRTFKHEILGFSPQVTIQIVYSNYHKFYNLQAILSNSPHYNPNYKLVHLLHLNLQFGR